MKKEKNYSTYKSEKFFYRKYRSKIMFYTPLRDEVVNGASFSDLDTYLNKINKLIEKSSDFDLITYQISRTYGWYNKQQIKVTKNELETCAKAIKLLLKDDKKLIQYGYGESFVVFTNMTDEWKQFLDEEKNVKNSIWEISPEAEKILSQNENICVVSKKPSHEYKIYLKPASKEKSLANFLKSNNDGFKVGDVTLENIEHGYYLNGNYFYAKNKKYLTLFQLSYPHCARRIDKMVYKYEDVQ